MKNIMSSILANDLVNIEKKWLNIKAILKNKNLCQQIVKQLAKMTKNADFILLEAGNEESISLGTLVAMENAHQKVLLKIEENYKTINISEICCLIKTIFDGYVESLKKCTGFNPAEKNDMAIVISAISSRLFPGEYGVNDPGSMIIDPEIKGNSTISFSYRDGYLHLLGFNISKFIDEKPNFIDKKIFSGFYLSKEYQQRIRSNIIVLQNINILDDQDSLISWQEIAEYEKLLENPRV